MKSSGNKMKGFGHRSKVNDKEKLQGLNNEFNQEQEALKFVKEGKLIEAEEIYQKLIKLGTKNHNIYGNLAALYGMKGNTNEMYNSGVNKKKANQWKNDLNILQRFVLNSILFKELKIANYEVSNSYKVFNYVFSFFISISTWKPLNKSKPELS